MKKLSHLDDKGRARMVDVGDKTNQKRIAKAAGSIQLMPETISLIQNNKIGKGSVLTVAEVAGIQAAKKTSDLIPLCHPLPISNIQVHAEITEKGVLITSEVTFTGKTGVEMEALTAVNIALLTVYDMCKAVDSKMVIRDVRLVEKRKEEVE
jgi:cyclic pyranopterin phosphate synthase